MSAFETMRVNSDNQTLILAGEAIPQRAVGSSSATALAQSTSPVKTLTPYQNAFLRAAFLSSTRGGASFNAANEYARTQDLSGNGMRAVIIDTYA
jgi:hypothetical protein